MAVGTIADAAASALWTVTLAFGGPQNPLQRVNDWYLFLTDLSVLGLCLIAVTLPRSVVIALTNYRSMYFQGFIAQVFLVIVFATSKLVVNTSTGKPRDSSTGVSRIVKIPGQCVHSQSPHLSKELVRRPVRGEPQEHLYVLEFCLISATVPESVTISLTSNSSISFQDYMAQLLLVILFAASEYYFALTITCSKDHITIDVSMTLGVVLAVVGFASIVIFQPQTLVSVFYTVVLPALNPFLICSVTNLDMKAALWKILKQSFSHPFL
ncbi:olfactory receptor 14I1-like [Tachyglossus aculeatus]|uniref:olfactory receptor 14I1-like n=1 Tax=Tachyglossus aculeatus TaxID=9261 RepID=UPI0018F6B00D|nr:olfactory receptor 14I1-like [Tachyglossus aculeatus]